MKKLIKRLWLILAALSAILTVVSCVKELTVQEQEVSFESSLTTELSQIEESNSIVATQLIVTEDKVECPRPTKYSVSFTYDETGGALLFLGKSVQSGTSIPLASLTNLSLTYQAKKMVSNSVKIVVSNDAPQKLSKELVWRIFADETYAVTLTKEGEGEVAISGADNLDAVKAGSKLTVTAEPADGWEVSSITANGKDITTDKSFVVDSDTNVRVVFKKKPMIFAITIITNGDGEVTVSGAADLRAVAMGSELTVIATPFEGWELVSLTANDVDILSSKTFEVTGNTTIRATFKKKAPKTYPVTLTIKGWFFPYYSSEDDPMLRPALMGKVAITGATIRKEVPAGGNHLVFEVPAGTELSVLALPPRFRRQPGSFSSGYYTPVKFIRMSVDGKDIVKTFNGIDISEYDSDSAGSPPPFFNGKYFTRGAFTSVGGKVVVNSDTEILVEFCAQADPPPM